MASVKRKIKCKVCGTKLKPEEQAADICKKCMYEYVDNWLKKLYIF